jgi:hypothetical protein
MPQPNAVTALADELTALYTRVQDSLIAELERIAADPNQRRYRQRLNEQVRAIDQALDQVDTQARVYLSRRFPTIYQIGAVEAARATGRPWTWSAIHTDAVAEIANRTYSDLLSATRYVRRDAKRLVRLAVRERTAFAVIGGQTATQAGRELAKTLGEQGVHAVRFANGARFPLGAYAEMAARTSTAQAYVQGTLRASGEAGVRWMECFDSPGCGMDGHNSGDPPGGTIRPIEEALAYPLSHPNCARSWSPRPDVVDEAGAKAAQLLPDEELQRLAVLERERARTHTVTGRLTQREKDRRQRLRTRQQRLARRQRRLAR